LRTYLISIATMILIIIDRVLLILGDVPRIVRAFSIIVIGAVLIATLFIITGKSVSFLLRLPYILEVSGGFAQIVLYLLLSLGATLLLSGIVSILISIVGIPAMESMIYQKSALSMIGAAPQTEYVIEVEDVYKDYYVGKIVVHALRGLSIRVRRGEFVAIMGPSGSGKSTLLNLIGALDRPTRGKIYIDGVDISKLDDNALAELRNRKIGFVFQSYNLINRTSVTRNVELPSIILGLSRRKRRERVRELLRIMGLDDDVLKRRPIQLSGGQQQRVAIARALMNNPSIILADEPTGNLDSKTGEEVMKYLRLLNKKFGTTVVVVTHDRSVAEMADRILYIRDGKIIGEEVIRGGSKD